MGNSINPIGHIFLDLDGVLANYFESCCRLFGFDSRDYPAGQWDMWTPMGVTKSDYLATVDREEKFWWEIEPFDHALDLVDLIKQLPCTWSILTSPWVFRHRSLHSDKVAWVRQHIDADVQVDFMVDKWRLARPDALLIDDGEHNVDRFREAGGQAILFPSLLNRAHPFRDDPLTVVKSQLQEIMGISLNE
jgi:hypothetical protein